jgi:hypothetical protein
VTDDGLVTLWTPRLEGLRLGRTGNRRRIAPPRRTDETPTTAGVRDTKVLQGDAPWQNDEPRISGPLKTGLSGEGLVRGTIDQPQSGIFARLKVTNTSARRKRLATRVLMLDCDDSNPFSVGELASLATKRPSTARDHFDN